MKKQSGNALVVIIVILSLAIIGTLGFLFWQSSQKTNTNANQDNDSSNNSTPDIDAYKGWKTYLSEVGKYELKFPENWIVIPETDDDGPYIRNMEPTLSGGGYPEGYINLRVLKYATNDKVSGELTAIEFYNKLGVSSVSQGPITYEPSTVEAYPVNGVAGKKSIASFDETDQVIFLLNANGLYEINLYPENATNDSTVQKILSSFKLL